MKPLIAALLISSALAAGAPIKVNPKDRLRYVWIAPGTFSMGCSARDTSCFEWEKPPHEVSISKGFWIGQTEVTQDAYREVTGTNPSRYSGPGLPVDQVSWFNARDYCKAVGMRLPTEAEWEYAARGSSSSARYGPLDEIAWHDENSADTTHPVASRKPNSNGLYDTLGNLWEWVEDAYPADPAKRILRGDSFVNRPEHVRVSDRLWARPETAHRDMGFRCAGD